jgi:transketolase
MGAVCNGLALAGGFIPYGATFLVFSDYMRPSVRLSAIMKIQSIWIFTHDSIFLGEDGPTHQPVEQLAALRLIPDLHVVRPADALEVAFAWAHAIERKHAPTAFALSRQKVPNLKRAAGFDARVMMQGAYVLSDSASAPDLVLMATGSEVHLAVEAKALLEAAGKHVRVVSAPCVEAFMEQPAQVRAAVLPAGVPVVAIEAGRTTGWHALVGSTGHVIGIDTYGASAPDTVLAEKFGLTAKRVVENITAWERDEKAKKSQQGTRA